MLSKTKIKTAFTGLAITSISLLLITQPGFAHHPFGGTTPDNLLAGFLSGLGHPVIGIDHLTFVIAVGLLALLKPAKGIFLPVTFALTTILGTFIHLLSLDLPFPEIIISASVLICGIMLAGKTTPRLIWLIFFAAIAGTFHGYAYGEAIVGAEMTPLLAYLAGFAIIQLAISLGTFQIGKSMLKTAQENPNLFLRFAGFTISGIGFAFLASTVLG